MELPKIKVADFEGPFDLLLHLIKKNKMNIYNIEIYKITNQYLAYLDTMKEMDLEITSEFIVIAATLIEIKSKSLLPKAKVEEELEEDIEKRLVEKLILYKKIKASTEYFKSISLKIGTTYSKKPEIIPEAKDCKVNNEDIFRNITLVDLYNMYNKLLENYTKKHNKNNVIQKNISVDLYKIEDKYDYLLHRIKQSKIQDFNTIMESCECKLECVVTFLALLELIKQRLVKVYQTTSFGEIIIEGCDESGEDERNTI
ncbi:MAG: segregation/condensation protein A [Clostridium baratii]|uniref:segregation/condensation protein A n=1 Tax=Clostridium baratii TaxID=1561 RepID=UPI00242CBDF8|nr:segregation/condensation protein A [Clostridium baratii]MBS6042783.1 segregation/condensation protein A [Clostridium baratii]